MPLLLKPFISLSGNVQPGRSIIKKHAFVVFLKPKQLRRHKICLFVELLSPVKFLMIEDACDNCPVGFPENVAFVATLALTLPKMVYFPYEIVRTAPRGKQNLSSYQNHFWRIL